MRTGERQPSTFEVGTDPIGKSTLPSIETLAVQFPDLVKDCNLLHPLTGEELSLKQIAEVKGPEAINTSTEAVSSECAVGDAA